VYDHHLSEQDLTNDFNYLPMHDGLNGMLPDSEIKTILDNYPNIDSCKDELIKDATRAGGFDNVTVALAQRTV
jgi:serine/threonine protein phosphatase PrpC